MSKFLVVTLFVFGPSALAATCLNLLELDPPTNTTSINPSRLNAARLWRSHLEIDKGNRKFRHFLNEEKTHLETLSSEDVQDRYVLSLWANWNRIGPNIRSEALALELRKLSPPNQAPRIDLNGASILQELSHKNKVRMLTRLREFRPVPEVSANFSAQVDQVASSLDFAYVRPVAQTRKAGVAEPIASSHLLARAGVVEGRPWFSKFLNSSNSVDFRVLAKSRNVPFFHNTEGINPVERLRLDSTVARRDGFMIPHFYDVHSLVRFFATWDPQAFYDLRSTLWTYIPTKVQTFEDLTNYLSTHLYSVNISSGEALAPLRQRLSQFVLTEEDGQDFLRQAFSLYLVNQTQGNQNQLDRLKQNFESQQAQVLFNDFIAFLQLKAFELRVPSHVSAAEYSFMTFDVPQGAEGLHNRLRQQQVDPIYE